MGGGWREGKGKGLCFGRFGKGFFKGEGDFCNGDRLLGGKERLLRV